MVRIDATDLSAPRFINSFKSLPPDIKAQASKAIADLTRNPMPGRLRFEKLSGLTKPAVYTIHVTRNHSHKASFELVGTVARMRSIGTHKEIDRAP